MGQECGHECARIDAIERRGPRIESLEMNKGGMSHAMRPNGQRYGRIKSGLINKGEGITSPNNRQNSKRDALCERARTGHHTERTLHGAHTRIEIERAGRHLLRPYEI